MSEHLTITDVAPRDGLQNQPTQLSTADKAVFVRLLALAGVRSVEAASFVSPKAVPQMADAAQLLPLLGQSEPDLRLSVLVPNLRGLERAIAAGAREIAVVLSATETMNLRNINMTLTSATAASLDTLAAAHAAGLRTRAYLAVAFECPYEGPTPPQRVLRLAAALHEACAGEIVVADTIGAAGPAQVRDLLGSLSRVVPLDQVGMHFHDTRGLGVANAWAALEAGVRRFDASVGGIGGCPFAPGAAGNVATEDLVTLAHNCGFRTGIDPVRLLEAVDFAQSRLGGRLGGRSAGWLRRQAYAAAIADADCGTGSR